MSAEIRGYILREASIEARKQLTIEENIILDNYYSTLDLLIDASHVEDLTDEDVEVFKAKAHELIPGSEITRLKYEILFEQNKQNCLSVFN